MKKHLVIFLALCAQLAFSQSVSFDLQSQKHKAEYSYTGSMQTFTVPDDVTEITIEAWGAEGGEGMYSSSSVPGLGGYATGNLTVTPGQILYIYVGGKGTDAWGSNNSVASGGYNGGGDGGYDRCGSSQAGGGGGASDVRILGTGLNNRILVAAGGGGAAPQNSGHGGDGGGLIGSDGTYNYVGKPGTGATQVEPGTTFTTTRGATDGALGLGGNGSYNECAYGSGGGGGGYYGGGGGTSTVDHGSGWAGGGGGGSSYIGGVFDAETETGNLEGNGLIAISYLSDLSTTLNYTGSMQTYTVPEGVNAVKIEAWGAQGGNGKTTDEVGGLGGFAGGVINVTPGQVLNIFVGGQGQSNIHYAASGGFNGGGGTDAQNNTNSNPGCGGGATDVRIGGTTLHDRIIVAGGGGGASGYNTGPGGAGGGLTGQDGQPPYWNTNYYGKGGTQSSGGAGGGTGSAAASPGIFGVGGSGQGFYIGGGGGGGGWYGGGGGSVNAGGGGSSYIGGVINGSTTQGVKSGNGFIVITELPTPKITAISTSTDDGYYNDNPPAKSAKFVSSGDIIDITLTFDMNVTVDVSLGIPYIKLNVNSSKGAKLSGPATAPASTAKYTSGSGSKQLTFTYEVQNGDNSADLDYTSVNDLILNSGTITNATYGNNADLTLPAVGTFAANHDIVIDTKEPTPVLSHSDANYTNDNPMVITVTFDEPVTGLSSGDFVVTNGTALNLNSIGNGEKYTVQISPASNGVVTVDLPASSAKDLATNNSNAATQLVRTFDSNRPTATISSTLNNPTNKNPITIKVNFSEEIKGLAPSDFVVTNGLATTVTTITAGLSYSVDVLVKTAGTVSIKLPANSVIDAAKNGNTESNTFSIECTSSSPTAILSATKTYSNTASFSVSVEFSKSITGLTVSDFAVSGGSATGLSTQTTGTNYTVTVVPSEEGGVSVYLPSFKVTDGNGIGNIKSNTLSFIYDETLPTVEVNSSVAEITNASNIPVTFTFSEAVSGFTADDISVTNGTASNLVTVSGKEYTADITPTADGTVSVSVASGVATDAAGNGNTAATLSVTSDKTAPTVVISSTYDGATNANPFLVLVTFSEAVENFAKTNITADNASIGSISSDAAGKVYKVNIFPSSEGNVNINIPAGTVSDLAGNSNSAASYAITYDATAPTVQFSSSAGMHTSNTSVTLTMLFSENINDFSIEDITASNATLSNFTEASKGTSYSVDVTPTEAGEVEVIVNKRGLTDDAGNTNSTNAYYRFTFDNEAPTATIMSSAYSKTNQNPIVATIKFNEEVVGMKLDDLTVTNAIADNLITVTEGLEYTVEISAEAEGAFSVTVKESAVSDMAGNSNAASKTITKTYDVSAPSASISTTATSPTNNKAININVEFDEAVVPFSENNIFIQNGTASNFTEVAAGLQYTLKVTADDDGTVTIYVANGSCSDAAGNGVIGSSVITIEYDKTAPIITDMNLLSVTYNAAQFEIIANEDGTVYYQVLEPIVTTPTRSEVISGSNDSIVTSGNVSLNMDEEVDIDLNGLDPEQHYILYYVTKDALGNQSKLMNTNFGTARMVDIKNILNAMVEVYPNPNNGKFYIDFGSADISNGKIMIRSTTGSLIDVIDVTESKQTIELNNIKQGVYLIQIQLKDGVINNSFVKE